MGELKARRRLVIEREYDPPPPGEMAELLHTIYRRLLGTAMLTHSEDKDTIAAKNYDEEEDDESSTLRAG